MIGWVETSVTEMLKKGRTEEPLVLESPDLTHMIAGASIDKPGVLEITRYFCPNFHSRSLLTFVGLC